jgi:hypothetical protein
MGKCLRPKYLEERLLDPLISHKVVFMSIKKAYFVITPERKYDKNREG